MAEVLKIDRESLIQFATFMDASARQLSGVPVTNLDTDGRCGTS